MPSTIRTALEVGKKGFHIGQRLVLPFRCQLIKLIIDGRIYTEVVGSKHIKIQQDPKNTSVYFRSAGDLDNMVGSYNVAKLIVAEWEADITDMNNHIKIVCEIEDNHQVNIHEPDEDMLFIE